MALSSAEAELNALTTGLTEAIFARNFVSELTGFKPAISVHTDSSAAKAIATRTGVTPRTKHLSIKALFAQAFFESGGGKLLKVPGTKTPADLFTKPLGPQELTKHFGALGFVVYGPRMDRADDDEDEIKMIPGSRANLMEVRRRALEVSGIGRAARAAAAAERRTSWPRSSLSRRRVSAGPPALWSGPPALRGRALPSGQEPTSALVAAAATARATSASTSSRCSC